MTGGEHNGRLATTEILTPELSFAWVTVATGALPSARRAMRAATLDNRVLLTGGRFVSDMTLLCIFRWVWGSREARPGRYSGVGASTRTVEDDRQHEAGEGGAWS